VRCFACSAPRPGGASGGGGPDGSSGWATSGSSSRHEQQPRKPGDWDCPECGTNNFARRSSCFSCNAPRPASAADAGRGDYGSGRSSSSAFGADPAERGRREHSGQQQQQQQRQADWTCSQCGEHNFGWRRACFACDAPASASRQQQQGGAAADRDSGARTVVAQLPGDWVCPECQEMNFARRTSCRACDAPRPAAARRAATAPGRAAAGGAAASRSGGGSKDDSASSSASRVRRKARELLEKATARCYGCGAALQTEVPAAAGFVAPDKFELKRKHRQLQQVLCERCAGLCNGAMIPAVQDFTQKAWAAQQQQLLLAAGSVALVADGASSERAADPASSSGGSDAGAGAGGAGEQAGLVGQLELLGKALVTPEQLRHKIAVRGAGASGPPLLRHA
jgi:rubredoxin